MPDKQTHLTPEDMKEALMRVTGLGDDDFNEFTSDEELKAFYDEVVTTGNEEEDPVPLVDHKGKSTSKKKIKKTTEGVPRKLTLKGGRKVPLHYVVVAKGDIGDRGYGNVIVSNPDEMHGFIDVVFELMPEIHKEYPVTIQPDYRIRAQVLFDLGVTKPFATAGRNVVHVTPKKDFTILDPAASKEEVQRMVDYMRSRFEAREDIENITAALIGN